MSVIRRRKSAPHGSLRIESHTAFVQKRRPTRLLGTASLHKYDKTTTVCCASILATTRTPRLRFGSGRSESAQTHSRGSRTPDARLNSERARSCHPGKHQRCRRLTSSASHVHLGSRRRRETGLIDAIAVLLVRDKRRPFISSSGAEVPKRSPAAQCVTHREE